MLESISTQDAIAMLMDGAPSTTTDTTSPADDGANAATQDLGDEEISQGDPDLEIDGEDEPEDPAIGDDVEDEESDEPELPAIEPPKSWNADDAAKFAKLPREAQEIITAREAQRDKATYEALEKAATQRKAAEDQAQHYTRLASELEQLLPRAEELFADTWAGAEDPNVWAQAFATDPQRASVLKAQYEAHKAQLTTLQSQKVEADKTALDMYQRSQAETLREMAQTDNHAKALIGPENDTNRQAVAEYLVKVVGVEPERLHLIAAKEFVAARKAYLYDKAVAESAKKKAADVPQNQASATRTRAPAGAVGKTQQTSQLEKATRRLAQTNSMQDAVALLLLREQSRSKRPS